MDSKEDFEGMPGADAGAKVLDTWYPAPAAAPANDNDRDPPPSTPPLELLMEDGLLGGTPPPAYSRPPPRALPPLGGASAPARGGMIPSGEAVQMGGGGAPTPDVEGDSGRVENDALVGCSVRCGKFAMIGLLLLGLVAVSAAVVVTMLVLKGDDPVTTSTSSTAVVTSTAGTSISTGATGTGTMSTAIGTSTSSTTMPKMITVSE